jgi:hypothetical protein
MQHRHLNHTEFTMAAIEDILARGRMPDWVPLIIAIRADPYGEIAEKTLLLCERALYAAPVFRRVIAAARNAVAAETSTPWTFPDEKGPNTETRRAMAELDQGKGQRSPDLATLFKALGI